VFGTLKLSSTPARWARGALRETLRPVSYYNQCTGVVSQQHDNVKSLAEACPHQSTFIFLAVELLPWISHRPAGPQRVVPSVTCCKRRPDAVNVTVPVGAAVVHFQLGGTFPSRIISVLAVSSSTTAACLQRHQSAELRQHYSIRWESAYVTRRRLDRSAFDLGRNLNPVPGINPTQYYITLAKHSRSRY